MSHSPTALAGTIAAIALLTYLTRALPFLLGRHGQRLAHTLQKSPALTALGPALIAALAVVTLAPDAQAALSAGRAVPYTLAGAATVVALRWRRDLGLAVLIGIVVYGLGLALLPPLG